MYNFKRDYCVSLSLIYLGGIYLAFNTRLALDNLLSNHNGL